MGYRLKREDGNLTAAIAVRDAKTGRDLPAELRHHSGIGDVIWVSGQAEGWAIFLAGVETAMYMPEPAGEEPRR